jgi:hypothetical protein
MVVLGVDNSGAGVEIKSRLIEPKKYEIEDLKSCLADLQNICDSILALTDNKIKTSIQILLNAALLYTSYLDGNIKDCGGVGFKSIDDTLDFLYNLENKK